MSDEKLNELFADIEVLKQRNVRVEADKAWESSPFRIGSICLITYVVAAAVLYLIGAERVWLAAIMPTLGFFLSTQSLPAIKRWWITNRYSKNGRVK